MKDNQINLGDTSLGDIKTMIRKICELRNEYEFCGQFYGPLVDQLLGDIDDVLHHLAYDRSTNTWKQLDKSENTLSTGSQSISATRKEGGK